MPKLKKINTEEARKLFHATADKRKMKKIVSEVSKEISQEIITATNVEFTSPVIQEKPNKIDYSKINPLTGRRRWRLAGSMKVWAKMYLESTDSVRDFRRWCKQKPGEALPWAWKVTYGDGEKSLSRPAGQVNLLVQILSGQSLSSPPPDDNQLLPVLVSQQIDTQSVVLPDSDPGNPENR